MLTKQEELKVLGTTYAYALHELGACIEQSEYGANFPTNDFEAALALAT